MGRIKDKALQHSESRRLQVCLGNLPETVSGIFCWCNRCGHNSVLDLSPLIDQFGPACPVPEIGARLRCTGCGSKDVATRPEWPSLGQVTLHDTPSHSLREAIAATEKCNGSSLDHPGW